MVASFREMKRDFSFATSIFLRRPFSVLLQVTNRCNMKCDFCDFWPNGAPVNKELTVADYEKLGKELSKLGTFLVSIEGGEPFVRKDILDIVKVLSKDHLTVLYTNGWYITAENAKQLFDNGLTQVGVSIDFPDAERHDAKRVLEGATERAWNAINYFKEAAPHGGRQAHVMTVYMEENRRDLEALLKQSEAAQVGHQITLLSTKGFRRAEDGGSWPSESVSAELLRLRKKYPHFRIFRDYLKWMDPFIKRDLKALPTCRAGRQSFNIDHLGFVAPCIEKIGNPVGNIREDSILDIHKRLLAMDEIAECQDCLTLCRGMSQCLGGGGTVRSLIDLGGRMRSN
ncbi:MAG: radical SAM protein [Planctomycetota bacterium]|nr:radical SAM protein [Planctomycetota bacterium]